MTELEKIAYAKSFIDKLANGINPLDDSAIPDNDITNNIRLSRCFFYVSDILRQVIENGGLQASNKKSKRQKKEFFVTNEELAKVGVADTPIYISEIADRLNSLIDFESTKKITASAITNWLLEFNFLRIVELPTGKTCKFPTDQGKEIGILAEERTGQFGTYFAVFYSSDAQLFIYDNISAIIECNGIVKTKAENQGKVWTDQQDELLINLFKRGISASEIAKELKRTRSGICARLKRLGFVEDRNDVK